MVEQLFLTVPRGCLQFVIVVFPEHTHLLFFKNQTNFAILKELEESANLPPPPRFSQHICRGKCKAAGLQQYTKDKRLPGILTYKVGRPSHLRFSWSHE